MIRYTVELALISWSVLREVYILLICLSHVKQACGWLEMDPEFRTQQTNVKLKITTLLLAKCDTGTEDKQTWIYDWLGRQNDETQKIMGTGRAKYRDRTTDVLDWLDSESRQTWGHEQGDRKDNKAWRLNRLQQETLMTRNRDETRNRLDTKGN